MIHVPEVLFPGYRWYAGLAVLPAWLTATACLVPGPGPCTDDRDCPTGYECVRTGDCVSADAIRSVRAMWTIDDAPAGPDTCAGIAELSLTFAEARGDDSITYEPVPCPIGRIYYDKMPRRFTLLILRAHDDRGQVIDSDAQSIPATGEVIFALHRRSR